MLKCNTVYLTRYQSMKIPVSFRTAYARADKQILVNSGATDNYTLMTNSETGTGNPETGKA